MDEGEVIGTFMDMYGWLLILVFIGVLALLTKPVGMYLGRVLDAQGVTFLDRILKPVEKGIYRLLGVDPAKEHAWQRYAGAVLVFSLVSLLATYAILRLQDKLPLNPQGFGALSPDLAFNTAVSFVTNTNWQSYAGENCLSYFSQMVGLTLQNFTSAAVGIGVAAALVRGIARHSAKTIGNFWVDLVRVHLYLLIPLSLIMAVFLVSQGVIQNFAPYTQCRLVEGDLAHAQLLPQGPVASQEAIKLLGTNGGGFFGANSAHPFENPTPLTNFIELLAIFLIPNGMIWYFGCMVGHRGHAWTIWAAILCLFLAGYLICWQAEVSGNPRLAALGIDATAGNLEGKELRFGIPGAALFTTVTTAASCGAVNAMFDSFTPLGGMVPLVNIQLGEVVFGGVGAGLYGMLIFVVLTVFIAGLMVGRTPEYLGKKIASYDVKVSVLYLMVPVFTILGMTAWAAVSQWGVSALRNGGPHGLTEILYAFSSATGNNGSAFAGLAANTVWYNTTLGLAMLLGRFAMIVPVLALAGSLGRKQRAENVSGGFPVTGVMFAGLLIGVILIVGALTFFPALALGPVVEHLLMQGSPMLY